MLNIAMATTTLPVWGFGTWVKFKVHQTTGSCKLKQNELIKNERKTLLCLHIFVLLWFAPVII